MICFAAVVPHNPQLITQGSDTYLRTLAAVEHVGVLLNEQQPDAILFVSAHAEEFKKMYSLPLASTFDGGSSLKQFGIINKEPYRVALDIVGSVQTCGRQHAIPFRTTHTETLDVGTALACRMLSITRATSIAVIGTCDRSVIDHIEVGYALKDVVHSSEKRVALIITGEGHFETDNNTDLLNIVTNRSVAALTKACKRATPDDCVLKPLACGFGLLRGFPSQTKILAHETTDTHVLVTAVLYSE